jgi:hypothetical protein
MATLLAIEAWGDSLTFDEPFYIRAGTCAYATGIVDLMPVNPPGYQLLAGAGVRLLARTASSRCTEEPTLLPSDALAFFPSQPQDLRWFTFAGRLPIVGLALLLAMVVFIWARALYGLPAGLLALAIAALEPSLLAHAHLATGDLAFSASMVAALGAHWAWTRSGQRRWLLLVGVAVGCGLLSKISTLYLIPILGLIELVRTRGSLVARLRSALVALLTVAGVGWALVCLLYLPFQTLFPHHYRWQAPLAWLAPPSWFHGLWFQLEHARDGRPGYINGQVFAGHGPWYYYLEAIAFKTSLGLLLLVALAAIVALRLRDRWGLLYLWWPAAFLVAVSSVSGVDEGVRYILPVYPLMAILAGSVLGAAARRFDLRLATAAVLLVGAGASSLTHMPNHLGYFNELAGARPARYLSDTNLDWGQDSWRLRDWWESQGRPPLSVAVFGSIPIRSYGIVAEEVNPTQDAVTGLLAVSAYRITTWGDLSAFPELRPPYAALRDRAPVARIGTSILVFQMNGERVSGNPGMPKEPPLGGRTCAVMPCGQTVRGTVPTDRAG